MRPTPTTNIREKWTSAPAIRKIWPTLWQSEKKRITTKLIAELNNRPLLVGDTRRAILCDVLFLTSNRKEWDIYIGHVHKDAYSTRYPAGLPLEWWCDLAGIKMGFPTSPKGEALPGKGMTPATNHTSKNIASTGYTPVTGLKVSTPPPSRDDLPFAQQSIIRPHSSPIVPPKRITKEQREKQLRTFVSYLPFANDFLQAAFVRGRLFGKHHLAYRSSNGYKIKKYIGHLNEEALSEMQPETSPKSLIKVPV